MPRDGWLKRQAEKTGEDIRGWPDWMRRAAGVDDKQETREPKKEERAKESSKR